MSGRRRAFLRASQLLLGLLVSTPGSPAVEPRLPAQELASVARERRVRRAALGVSAYEPATDALGAARWEERAAALEAERRAQLVGRAPAIPSESLRAALDDAHPSVRAVALAVGSERGEALAVERARTLAADALPAVRLALVRALERAPGEGAAELLLARCDDQDARVARAAERALFTLPDEEPVRAALERRLNDRLARGEGVPAELWWRLDRAGPTPATLEALRRRLAREPGEGVLGASACVEAIALGRFGSGDLERLLRGWNAAARDPEGRALLASCLRSGDVSLARRLFEGFTAPGGGGLGAGRLAVLLDAVSPPRLLEWMRAEEGGRWPDPADLELVAARLERWPPWATAWILGSDSPALLATAAEGMRSILHRTADPGAGEGLLQLLAASDPPAPVFAFRAVAAALAKVGPPTEATASWEPRLARHWRRLSAESRERVLRDFPRGLPLPSFRRALLERVDDASLERALGACELLAGLAPDPEVRAALAAWTEAGLVALERALDARSAEDAASASASTQYAAMERAAHRLGGVLRALEAFADDEHGTRVVPMRAAFGLVLRWERVRGRPTPILRWCAERLAARDDDRRWLTELLATEGERWPVPARLEVALAIVAAERDAPGEPALSALLDALPGADGEARQRVLRALGTLADERSLRFLERYLEGGAPWEDRLLALESLAQRAAVGALGRAFEERTLRNVELRRALVRALGSFDVEPVRRALAERLLALEGERRARPGRALPEEEALLRDELLAAVARAGPVPEALLDVWLARPLDEAAAALERRWGAERGPRVGFDARGEIRMTQALARAGQLAEALARAAPGWVDLGGELLEALAAAAERGGDRASAERLVEAAAVAWLGEAPAEGGTPAAEALARQRVWLLRRAIEGRDWPRVERLAAGLDADLRSARLPVQRAARVLGRTALGAGVEPAAWLATLVPVARGWGALERGARAEARGQLEAAAERAGRSAAAREALRALGAALGSSSGR